MEESSSGGIERKSIRIRHVQASYGSLGPIKDDNVIYPKEELYLRFSIINVMLDELGNVDVDLQIILRDVNGQELISSTSNLCAKVAFGNNTFPGQARVELPSSSIAGDYVLALRVKDNLTGHADHHVYHFVLKTVTSLAMINPRFYLDENATVPSTPGGFVGQTLHYKMSLIGIDKSDGSVRTSLAIQVLDSPSNEPTMPQPVKAVVILEKESDYLQSVTLPVVDFAGHLVLTRPGKFTFQATMTDENSHQTIVFETPLTVRNRNQVGEVTIKSVTEARNDT